MTWGGGWNSRARVACFALIAALSGSVAGNLLTVVGRWAVELARIAQTGGAAAFCQSFASGFNVPLVILGVLASCVFCYGAAAAARELRVGFKVLAKGDEISEKEAGSHALVLTPSFLFRDNVTRDDELVKRRAAMMRRFIVGREPGVLLRKGSDGGSLAQDIAGDREWQVADLCHRDAQLLDNDGTSLQLKTVAWQQAWRTYIRLADHEHAALQRVHILPSDAFLGASDAYLKDYCDILKAFANRTEFRNNPSIICSAKDQYYRSNNMEDVESILKRIVEDELARDAVGQVCIDITGGNRLYSAAAAICSMRERVIMAYVAPADEDEDPRPRWLDIRPQAT